MDQYVSNTIMEYSKKNKINWGIKYQLSEKMINYLTLRNIISMWNLYDILLEDIKDISLEQQAKKIVQKYIQKLGIEDIRKDNHPKLKEKLDKNYIEGQISVEDYLNNEDDNKNQDNEQETSKMQEMFQEAENLRNQPFDSTDLQVLEQLYGRFEIVNHLTIDIIQYLSIKDRYILGFIDYVDYKNQMYHNENNNKRK